VTKIFRCYFSLTLLLGVAITGASCGGADITSFFDPPAAPSPTPQRFAVDVTTVNSGLAKLNSYRANLAVDFNGTRSGQPSSGRIESLTEINRPAAARHHYLNVNATIPHVQNRGISEFFQVDRQIYVTSAGEASAGETMQFEAPAGSQISPGTLGFFELDRLVVLPAMVSTPPQTETLHGQPVQRYSFTQADLPSDAIIFEQAQGNLWVAETDNYLVQYVISATVKMPTPIPNAHILDQGSLNLSYTLTDVNADVPISPPAQTGGSFANFPPPPDSQITAVYPTLIEYSSVTSPISATLFYQTGLPPNGWTEESADLFEEKARLIYSKDSQRLTILITPTDNPNKIKIVLDMLPGDK